MNIMVTGAAGEYGAYALAYLKKYAQDATVIAQVRDRKKAELLENLGYEVRVADYSDAEGMKSILNGIDRLLFVSTPVQGVQKNVVDAAVANGVKYIAYTSIYEPQYSKGGLEINHKQTEGWIRASGIPFTILRDNWYTEVNQGLIRFAAHTKEFPLFAGEGKLSTALKREYAEVGAIVISEGGYPEILNLAGKPYTYRELAQAISETIGEHVDVIETTEQGALERMVSGGTDQKWAFVANFYQGYALKGSNGEADADPAEFEAVLGRSLTPLADAVREIIGNRQ